VGFNCLPFDPVGSRFNERRYAYLRAFVKAPVPVFYVRVALGAS